MSDEVLVQRDTSTSRAAGWDHLTTDALTLDAIQEFQRAVFSGVEAYERIDEQARKIPDTASGGELLRKAIGTWAVGRHREAIPLLRRAGSRPEILICLGRSLAAAGEMEEARAVLSQVPAGHAAAPLARALFLTTYERVSAWETLAKELAKAAGILEGTPWQNYFQGRLAESERRREEALDHYQAALDLDEDHQESLFRTAYLLDLGGLDEEAMDHYQRCLHCVPANVAAVLNLGILYEDNGDYRKAMRLYDFVLRLYPNHHRARLFRRDSQASLHMYFDEDLEKREDRRNQVMRIPITDFELSVRSRNCLAKMNIRTLGDLVKKTESELLSYKNFGETSLGEIKEILKSKGLRLGMDQEELLNADLEAELLEEEEDDDEDDLIERPPSAVEGSSDDLLGKPIADLDLSLRCKRIMDSLKIRTIEELCMKTEAELLACQNFGQTSLNEVKSRLEELGLSLRG